MTPSTVQSAAYNSAGSILRREIAELQARAYGPSRAPLEDGDIPPLHDPRLGARSFFIRLDGRIVSYAAVVTTTIQHGGRAFTASGLSCVATDPDYQRRGLATLIVAAATSHLAHSGIDIGIFTCAPALVPLYQQAGGWQPAPAVVLIGSADPGALTSESLGVVVLLRLCSAQARAASATLRDATIDLGLPVGQFW